MTTAVRRRTRTSRAHPDIWFANAVCFKTMCLASSGCLLRIQRIADSMQVAVLLIKRLLREPIKRETILQEKRMVHNSAVFTRTKYLIVNL